MPKKVKEVVESIQEAGGTAIAVAADVLDRASLEQARAEIVEQFGRVDMLINGAGGNHPDAITDPESL